jgi:hypothetical protein
MAMQVDFFSVPFLRKARRKIEGDCSGTYTIHTSLSIETETNKESVQVATWYSMRLTAIPIVG